jgi:hypothetical protein
MRRKIHYNLYQIWRFLYREHYIEVTSKKAHRNIEVTLLYQIWRSLWHKYYTKVTPKEHTYEIWKRLRPYWSNPAVLKRGWYY